MVVFFRLIGCLMGSLFRPRIGPLDSATLRMRVWPNDLDLNVHVNSGRYLSFTDIGRVDLLVRMRVMRKVLALKWRPIAGATRIVYRRSLLPFERFATRTRVVAWDEKWFYYEQIVENGRGELSAVVHVRMLFRGPQGNVTPADLVALTGLRIESPPIPKSFLLWREAERSA